MTKLITTSYFDMVYGTNTWVVITSTDTRVSILIVQKFKLKVTILLALPGPMVTPTLHTESYSVYENANTNY